MLYNLIFMACFRLIRSNQTSVTQREHEVKCSHCQDEMMITIIGSIVLGAVLTLVVQMWLIKKWFFALPKLEPPVKNQFDDFKLPEVCNRTKFKSLSSWG